MNSFISVSKSEEREILSSTRNATSMFSINKRPGRKDFPFLTFVFGKVYLFLKDRYWYESRYVLVLSFIYVFDQSLQRFVESKCWRNVFSQLLLWKYQSYYSRVNLYLFV